MDTVPEASAWLIGPDGALLPLEGSSSLGRSQTLNRYAVAHDKVSRRHALIHAQEGGEFWLVDLGSTNGTYVAAERVTAPTRLRDGARIDLGRGVAFTFRQPVSAEERRAESMMQKTVFDTHQEHRWLLIADIAGFSTLSKTMPAAELAVTVGRWLAAGAELLALHGGRINKYTGDGFLAFWRDHAEAPPAVAAALRGFHAMDRQSTLSFRIVLHRGVVAVGGAPSLGEESLMSDDLSFAFRLEKLAGLLALPFLLSPAAATLLTAHLGLRTVPGRHELKGFPPVEGLATFADPPPV